MTARLTRPNMLAVIHAGQVLAMQSVPTQAAHDALSTARARLGGIHITGNDPGAWHARRRIAEAALRGVAQIE